MRLINTKTCDFEVFYEDTPRYAILSHTWGDDAISYQEYSWLREQEKKLAEKSDISSEPHTGLVSSMRTELDLLRSKAGYSKIKRCMNLLNTGRQLHSVPVRIEVWDFDQDTITNVGEEIEYL